MPMVVSDPFFEAEETPFKECSNPNDPEDKSLCIVVQDGSPFDGAIVRYTTFKLADSVGDDGTIGCTYEYDFEIPPHDLGHEISDEEGKDFERKLGIWVIEILQKQMNKMELNATTDRTDNT